MLQARPEGPSRGVRAFAGATICPSPSWRARKAPGQGNSLRGWGRATTEHPQPKHPASSTLPGHTTPTPSHSGFHLSEQEEEQGQGGLHPGNPHGAGDQRAPFQAVEITSPAPARAMAPGSVALCMAQRSRPTLTSCQPPSPSSKVVAPAKPSDHCCGTMELPRLPQPKLGVPWAPLPQPHRDSGHGELGAKLLPTDSPQSFSSEPSVHVLAKSQASSLLMQLPSSQVNSPAMQVLARSWRGSAVGDGSDGESPRLECSTGRV